MRSLLGFVLAVSIALLPACAPLPCEPGVSRCEGNVRHGCYRTENTAEKSLVDCAAESQLCVEVDNRTAICADSATPDTRCANDLAQAYSCDGNVLVTCQHGYLAQEEDCGFEQCLTVGFNTACFDTSDPCFTLPNGRHCDDDVMRDCGGGQLVTLSLCRGCTLDAQGRPVDHTGDLCL